MTSTKLPTMMNLRKGDTVTINVQMGAGHFEIPIAITRDGLYDFGAAMVPVDKPKHQPWAPPYDETDPLACAVTGHVDADAVCGCAGCSATRVRGR